jgi:cytoskeletal protein CcmA (bactofilin family)
MFGFKKPGDGPENTRAELPEIDDLPPLPAKFTVREPALASANRPRTLDSMLGDHALGGYKPEIPRRPLTEFTPVAKPTPPLGAPLAPASTAASPAPAYTPPPVPQFAPRSSDADAKTLIVGREISLNGQISACDKLIVEGRVEANLTDCRYIEVADSGSFKGSAEIDDMEVRGRVEGKITVRRRLHILSTGRVNGEIRYGQIEIECGGEISGTVKSEGEAKKPATVLGNVD